MKKLLLLLLLFPCVSFSQEDTLVYENSEPEPEFPGGFDLMMVWIQEDLIKDEEVYANMRKFCFTNVFLVHSR